MGKSKRILIIFLTIMGVISIIFATYFSLFSHWVNPDELRLVKAKSERLSSQNYPIWGLDISHHNGKIDWSKVVITKPHFIFIKATEGITVFDHQFDTNWVYLKKHKVVRGAYHFFSFKSTGKQQAKHFISNVKLSKGDLPPVLDVEFCKKMPSKKKVAREILSWVDAVEKQYKVKPIIYCPWRFYKKYLKDKLSEDYKLWICDYRMPPDASIHWNFWQHTDSFYIPGINFTFDRNVFRYDLNAFNQILIK